MVLLSVALVIVALILTILAMIKIPESAHFSYGWGGLAAYFLSILVGLIK